MRLVSVIIPVYNREKLIVRAIKSVLSQTYTNLELIVVDDSSTDNTEGVIKANVHDNRFHYVKLEKNSGACVARNTGIERANGEYIAFQDSDDVWHNDKLQIQISEMEKCQMKISFCNMNRYQNNKKTKEIIPENCKKKILNFDDLITESIVSTQCLIAKKECFENVLFDPQMPRLQDYDIVLRLSQKYNFLHINKELVDVYVQDDSISSHPERGIIAYQRLWKKYSDYLTEHPLIKKKWYINMASALEAANLDSTLEYRKALKIAYDNKTFVKCMLARLNILNFIRNLYHKFR